MTFFLAPLSPYARGCLVKNMGCQTLWMLRSHTNSLAGLRNTKGKCSAFFRRVWQKEINTTQEERRSKSQFWLGRGISEAPGSPRLQWKGVSAGKQRDVSFIAFKESFISHFDSQRLQPEPAQAGKYHSHSCPYMHGSRYQLQTLNAGWRRII